MKTTPFVAALLLPLAVLAQPTPILAIDDPEGDDAGDGALVYPRDSSFEAGDLDLRSLRAYAERGGVRFEASFRNPVRNPSVARPPGLGSEDLSVFARHGFYAFNLDLYIDTDRVPGSGNTVMLPGRRATVEAASAWERAIVLTPRPELMRRQLVDALAPAAAGGSGEAEAMVDRVVFFATDVRVRGRSVSFSVPDSVIDAPTLARSSLVAVVTEAKLSIEAEGNLTGRIGSAGVARLSLGVAEPEPGRPLLAMGFSGGRLPATSIVDLLNPAPEQQHLQLASGVLTGLSRENHYGAGPASALAEAPRAAAADPVASAFSRALAALVRADLAAAPTPVAPAAVASPPVAAPAAVPAPAVVKPRDDAFYEQQEQRLRALKRLRDGGLITEDEYQRKRREVLDAL